jgi:hypothetical protein
MSRRTHRRFRGGRALTRQGPRQTSGEPLLTHFSKAAWTVPAALLILVVLVEGLTPSSLEVGNWLIVVPLVAAALCSPRVTVVFGILTLLANRMVNALVASSQLRVEDFLLQIFSVVLAVVVAVLRNRVHGYLLHLRSTAETTRQVILRPIPPGWGGVESAAKYLAADAEARVGGDFYEVLATPFGARVMLGDVQGKGLPAVSTAGAVVAAFREAGYHEPDLAVVADRMEQGLRRHNLLRSEFGDLEERFATVVLVAFPEAEPGVVEVVNFGHEGPMTIGPQGVRRLPQEQGPPLGLADLAGGTPPVRPVLIDGRETVLMVTDGVTEARDETGDFFPLRSWLEQLSARQPDGVGPTELLDALIDAVLDHTGRRLTDDAALLAVRKHAPRSTAGPGSGAPA